MKSTVLAALFFVFGSLHIYGQDSGGGISADINVSAEVMQSIQLVTVNSMRFGDMQPEQGQIYINPINSLNAGYMIAIGTPDAEFQLNYLPERELTNINGNSTLTFTYEISGNTEEDQATSELLDIENRNIRFNSGGRYYIWVGGRVNLENATPGNYQGDFTIEIDYI